MKVVVTGLHGTLAPVLAAELAVRGCEPVGWDRDRVPPSDPRACREFLAAAAPAAVCHLAMGTEDWAALLASWCREQGVAFLFTSTAMVFDHLPDGPHAVDDERNARDDYGRYKIRCEDAIATVSDNAIVARIGWQIGTDRGGNNMLEALHATMERHGVIRASRRWTPACSFMADTAVALADLLDRNASGTHHLDANVHSALDYPTIVDGLRRRHGADWRIEPTDDYRHDQRLLGSSIELPSMVDRLGLA